MLKVSQLIKFISDMNPQSSPARLSLYNFLKHFPQPNENLSPELINQFFSYSMDYPHWQGNRVQLGKEVQFVLNNFNSLYQQKFSFIGIKFPQDMQVIEIEHFSDLLSTVEIYLNSAKQDDDKIRLISDQQKRVIAIILKSNGDLEVRSYDKKFTIRDGALEPLRTDLVLHYNSNLELKENCLQKMEVAPYIIAQFSVNNGCSSGSMMRGFVFQKYQEFHEETFSESAKIFYPIKRMEQFFIDRRTDPYYGDITSSVERTINLIQNGDKESLKWAGVVLTKAQNALDHVFVGDKLLTLLIRDLKNTSLSSSGEKEACLTISPLKELDLIN